MEAVAWIIGGLIGSQVVLIWRFRQLTRLVNGLIAMVADDDEQEGL